MSNWWWLVVALAMLPGCPGRQAPEPVSIKSAPIAAGVLATAIASDDPNLSPLVVQLALQLEPEQLADPALHAPPLADIILQQLAPGSATDQTRQHLIDLLAPSVWWGSLDASAKSAHLSWAGKQAKVERLEEREIAAYALYRLGGPEGLVPLTAFLPDPERTVRAIVAEGYGRHGGGTEWPTIQRLATDENEYVRLRAAKALALWTVRLGPSLDWEQVERYLAPLESDQDPFVRRMAAQVRGIQTLLDNVRYRAQIYTPLLRGSPPPADPEDWEAFRDTALGRFHWALGYDLPVPSGIARLVFQFLWDEHPDLRADILEAAATQSRPSESGFLQAAWRSGDPALQKRALELLLEILLKRGEVDEEFDEWITAIGDMDWIEQDPVLRDLEVRLILTLARSRSLARFPEETVRGWETKVTDLFYSPRDSVRQFAGQLNPQHPWLVRAAAGRFAGDQRLRRTLPRLARMVWYAEDPRLIDPATGLEEAGREYPLTADELDLCWHWGVRPPDAVLLPLLSAGEALDGTAIRAAALLLRGAVPLAPLEPDVSGGVDWAEPGQRPRQPAEFEGMPAL